MLAVPPFSGREGRTEAAPQGFAARTKVGAIPVGRKGTPMGSAVYSPTAKVPAPFALQASLQISGRGTRTDAASRLGRKWGANPAGRKGTPMGSAVYSPSAKFPAPFALQASLQTSGRGNRTDAAPRGFAARTNGGLSQPAEKARRWRDFSAGCPVKTSVEHTETSWLFCGEVPIFSLSQKDYLTC